MMPQDMQNILKVFVEKFSALLLDLKAAHNIESLKYGSFNIQF